VSSLTDWSLLLPYNRASRQFTSSRLHLAALLRLQLYESIFYSNRLRASQSICSVQLGNRQTAYSRIVHSYKMREGSFRSNFSAAVARPKHSSRSNRSFNLSGLPNLSNLRNRNSTHAATNANAAKSMRRGGGAGGNDIDDYYETASQMADADRARTRRERTFIGNACAVCEEPLEHTLRGERILQFSCSHVSHEACFYEYIKEFESQYCPTCSAPLGLDTSRGGNVLDLGKCFAFFFVFFAESLRIVLLSRLSDDGGALLSCHLLLGMGRRRL
jgi:hypothetical protein